MKNDKKQILLQRGYLLPFVKFFLIGIFLLFQLTVSAQQRAISGNVTGANNEPMAGVTVLVKGMTQGTLTDPNGKFSLSIPQSAKTLVFSFIGMVTQEVEIGADNVYNIVLSETAINLDEVVVVGYGTQKKISVTGAITSVATEQLVKSPSASIANSITGRVTGVTTVQYSGRPGGDDPLILVRGIGSLSTSASTPLVLVDGVERPFTQLDPNEIESISVLKDASATAIYGIRGANGVLIVTTKRGFEGAPKISFSTSSGLQMPNKIIDNCNSYQYAVANNQMYLNDDPNAPLRFSPVAIKAFKDQIDGTATLAEKLIYPNTDWYKFLVKPASYQQQNNLNITGGNEFVQYFVSLGSLYQDGMFKTFGVDNNYSYGYKRYNYRANLDFNVTKSTTLSLTIGGRSEQRSQANYFPREPGFTGLNWSDPFSGLLYEGKHIAKSNRYIGISAWDGLTAVGFGTGLNTVIDNIMNLDIGLTQKMNFITKGLSWRFKVSNNTNGGIVKTRSTSLPTYTPFYSCDVSTAPGDSTIVFRKDGSEGLLGYSESSSLQRNWYLETAFSYNRDFGPHHITGLLLYNESKSFYPSTFTDIPTGYVGIAARATYDYKLKYLVDFNLGYNGSENFAPGKRFGLFPAVSVGWVPTEESFLKGKIPFLDYLKLRFSFGIVGNDKQGGNRFLYLPTAWLANLPASGAENGNINNGYSYSTGYSFGTNTSALQLNATEGRLGNPDVTWETATKQDYGIDLILFKNLGVTVDYFYELRKNILGFRNTVPQVFYAFALPIMNIGRVENHGYEVELKWRNKIGEANYYLTTNMSFARNKILYIDEIPKNQPWLYQTGKSVGTRFGYVFDGFYTQEDMTHLSDFPDALYNPKPGDVKYKDLDKNGIINSDDQQAIGYPDWPEYIFGISGGADFKGFDISMLWNGATNVSRDLNDTWRQPFGGTGDRNCALYLVQEAYTPETATTAKLPRLTANGLSNNTKNSELWLRDASYLRLKNMEIGYSFNAALLKRLGISKIRIYANGYDLLTLSKLKIIDPELKTDNFHTDYPLIKIVNLGLNVIF
jgi:TonB-linked SusC/RagA family outer membrane protein